METKTEILVVPRHYLEEYASLLGKTYWEFLDEIKKNIDTNKENKMDKFYLVKSVPNWADEFDFEGFDLFSEDEYKNEVKDFLKRAKEKRGCVAYYGSNENDYVFAEGVLYDLEGASIINIDQHTFLMDKFGKHYGKTLYNLYRKERDEVSEDYDDYCHNYEDEELVKLTLEDFGIEEE